MNFPCIRSLSAPYIVCISCVYRVYIVYSGTHNIHTIYTQYTHNNQPQTEQTMMLLKKKVHTAFSEMVGKVRINKQVKR